MGDRINVPNGLTLARVVMAALAAFLAADGRAAAAAGLLVAAALLDAFDGWYARTFAQCSDLGRHLDPFADKVLVGVVYGWVGVGADSALVWVLIGVVMAREAGITALRSYSLRRHGRFIPASPLGRVKMFLQCTTGLFVLCSTHWFGRTVSLPIVAALLVVAAGVSYLSAAGYVRHWKESVRRPVRAADGGPPLRIERVAGG